MSHDRPEDGRQYHIGDKVVFTDDEGKQAPGVVHGVRYKQGRYELVGFDREDNYDENSPIVPGTGRMELVKGTEDERHSFEYIIVHEHEHKAHHNQIAINKKAIKEKDWSKYELPLDMKQHIRVFEEDDKNL
jgi:hypothetical protein